MDSRLVPWETVRRWLLQSGIFLPTYQPLLADELAVLLERACDQDSAVLADVREHERMQSWLATLRPPNCLETENADVLSAHWRGRVLLHASELGDVLAGEAGHGVPQGWSVALEPSLEARYGHWWLLIAPRLRGPVGDKGAPAPSALQYSSWPIATGRAALGNARTGQMKWRLDWPVFAMGAHWGYWSGSVGWLPRRSGLSSSGGLALDRTAPSFCAATVRRTAPFHWRGLARRIAPTQLLFTAGLLSTQRILVDEGWRSFDRRDRPWFFQWLLTFRHTNWLRTTVSSSALASPRSGSLWPDLMQINYPLLSATSAEIERGPVTDRIFSLQFEARYRNAPWPLLPAAAGRIYWEYAGEDFIPHKTLKFIPQIAAPASIIGMEMVSSRWDLACEYVELEHPEVLWYSHSGFSEGYSHHDWVLGHSLGGGGESMTGWLRWRPHPGPWEAVLRGARSTWGSRGRTPGQAETWTWSLSIKRITLPVPWELMIQWRDECVKSFSEDEGESSRQWVRVTWQWGL